jgi:hypothetical protein
LVSEEIKLYRNKFRNVGKMDKFLGTYNLLKFNHEDLLLSSQTIIKNDKEGAPPNLFYRASVTLIINVR